MSGPLADRIDLRVVMPRMEPGELVALARPETSAVVAARIARAWEHVRAIAGGHHVRIRYIMHLAVYRKQVPPAVGSAFRIVIRKGIRKWRRS